MDRCRCSQCDPSTERFHFALTRDEARLIVVALGRLPVVSGDGPTTSDDAADLIARIGSIL